MKQLIKKIVKENVGCIDIIDSQINNPTDGLIIYLMEFSTTFNEIYYLNFYINKVKKALEEKNQIGEVIISCYIDRVDKGNCYMSAKAIIYYNDELPNEEEIEGIFYKKFESKNPITPIVFKYGSITKDLIYELSKNYAYSKTYDGKSCIIGVTFLYKDSMGGWITNHRLSTCFIDTTFELAKERVKDYLAEIKLTYI